MKTRNIIGKKIVHVEQGMQTLADGVRHNVVEYIELENGIRLTPFALETEDATTAVEMLVVRPNK